MFKKKIKEKEEQENQDQKEELAEYELQQKFDRMAAKDNRKYRTRKIILFVCIAVGFLGAIRSCTFKQSNASAKEIEAQTFVKTYAKNYYAYPATETKKYLKQFSLSDEWMLAYEKGIETALIQDVDIYKIDNSQQDSKGITKYFCYGTLVSKSEGQASNVMQQLQFAVSVAKKGSRYMVIQPIENIMANIQSITDEDVIKELTFDPETPSQGLDDGQKSQLQTTLSLFIKTYNDDVVQARLLCTSNKVIDELDPTITLLLKNIISSSQDDNKIYATAEIQETNGIYTVTRKYYFEVQKEKNKIEKMEVF